MLQPPPSDGCIPFRVTILAPICFRDILPLFKHRRACCSLFRYQHNGLPCHVISAKNSRAATEAQRTWRPSRTDVFRLCCCSLWVRRHRAREVIHDASLFLVTVSRHTVCSGWRINTALVLFWSILLSRYIISL